MPSKRVTTSERYLLPTTVGETWALSDVGVLTYAICPHCGLRRPTEYCAQCNIQSKRRAEACKRQHAARSTRG